MVCSCGIICINNEEPKDILSNIIHELKCCVIIQNHETDKYINIFNPNANPGYYWGGRYGANYGSPYGTRFLQIQIQFCETCGNIERCHTLLNNTIKCKCTN